MSSQAAGLIGHASITLRENGYETRTVALSPEIPMLLAENDFFVLGMVEFSGADELPRVEAMAAAELSDRLHDVSGVKRWDAYLVLLSSDRQDTNSPLSESLASIVYNTQFFRRVVRWGIFATTESLSRALRAFLPLTAATAGSVVSPAERLAASLTSFGIPRDEAQTALTRWREWNRDDAP